MDGGLHMAPVGQTDTLYLSNPPFPVQWFIAPLQPIDSRAQLCLQCEWFCHVIGTPTKKEGKRQSTKDTNVMMIVGKIFQAFPWREDATKRPYGTVRQSSVKTALARLGSCVLWVLLLACQTCAVFALACMPHERCWENSYFSFEGWIWWIEVSQMKRVASVYVQKTKTKKQNPQRVV